MEKYLELTKSLISEFDKSSSDYFEIHISDYALTLEKGLSHPDVLIPDNSRVSSNETVVTSAQAEHEAGEKSGNLHEIKSPIVGVFYESREPEAAPFVSVGQKVKTGDVLCILESMKMMNEIRSDYDGVVKEIKCKNEELVEFGQVLFVLENE